MGKAMNNLRKTVYSIGVTEVTWSCQVGCYNDNFLKIIRTGGSLGDVPQKWTLYFGLLGHFQEFFDFLSYHRLYYPLRTRPVLQYIQIH